MSIALKERSTQAPRARREPMPRFTDLDAITALPTEQDRKRAVRSRRRSEVWGRMFLYACLFGVMAFLTQIMSTLGAQVMTESARTGRSNAQARTVAAQRSIDALTDPVARASEADRVATWAPIAGFVPSQPTGVPYAPAFRQVAQR